MIYFLTISKDAISIFKTIKLHQDQKPDFWQCYEIAQKNNCDYFTLENE